jgi:solute carrier family 15 (peptide/histidine transporter), member 3/4
VPGLIFSEVVAFYGVYLNLVVYLQDVLHGDTASNAAAVNFWAAASFLMPVIGVAIADSFWGKYKTVLVGFSMALIVRYRIIRTCLAEWSLFSASLTNASESRGWP